MRRSAPVRADSGDELARRALRRRRQGLWRSLVRDALQGDLKRTGLPSGRRTRGGRAGRSVRAPRKPRPWHVAPGAVESLRALARRLAVAVVSNWDLRLKAAARVRLRRKRAGRRCAPRRFGDKPDSVPLTPLERGAQDATRFDGRRPARGGQRRERRGRRGSRGGRCCGTARPGRVRLRLPEVAMGLASRGRRRHRRRMVFSRGVGIDADSLEFVSTIQNRKVGTSHRAWSAALRSARHNAPRLHGTCVAREAGESRGERAHGERRFLGARARVGEELGFGFPSIVRTRASSPGRPARVRREHRRAPRGTCTARPAAVRGMCSGAVTEAATATSKNQKSRLQMALEEDARGDSRVCQLHRGRRGPAGYERRGGTYHLLDGYPDERYSRVAFTPETVFLARARARDARSRAVDDPRPDRKRDARGRSCFRVFCSRRARGSTRRRTPNGATPERRVTGCRVRLRDARLESPCPPRIARSSSHPHPLPSRPETRSARSPRFFLPESHFGEATTTRNETTRSRDRPAYPSARVVVRGRSQTTVRPRDGKSSARRTAISCSRTGRRSRRRRVRAVLLLATKPEAAMTSRRFSAGGTGKIHDVEMVDKEDLTKNHLPV